jgi:hypothetical protein
MHEKEGSRDTPIITIALLQRADYSATIVRWRPGRLLAFAIATVAEMRSRDASLQVASAHKYLREVGRWGGGKWPYGYRTIPNPDGKGHVLIIDRQAAAVILEARERVIRGEAVTAIAADFNRREIPSPMDHMRKLSGKGIRCTCRHAGHEEKNCPRCSCKDYVPAPAGANIYYRCGSMSKVEFVRGDQIALIRRSLDAVHAEFDSGSYDYPGGEQEYHKRVSLLSAPAEGAGRQACHERRLPRGADRRDVCPTLGARGRCRATAADDRGGLQGALRPNQG